jgi:uncharacterized membrane protein
MSSIIYILLVIAILVMLFLFYRYYYMNTNETKHDETQGKTQSETQGKSQRDTQDETISETISETIGETSGENQNKNNTVSPSQYTKLESLHNLKLLNNNSNESKGVYFQYNEPVLTITYAIKLKNEKEKNNTERNNTEKNNTERNNTERNDIQRINLKFNKSDISTTLSDGMSTIIGETKPNVFTLTDDGKKITFNFKEEIVNGINDSFEYIRN